MKRFLFSRILLVAMMLFGFNVSEAQTHYSSRVSIGAKGGVDLSRIFFNPSVRQNFKIGAVGGVTFRYVEESHFGLIAEMNFVQRGWAQNFEETPYEYSRTINYIEIPVLAHIYFGRRGRFFFNAGPQVAFALGESTSCNFDVDKISTLPGFPYHNRTWHQLRMKTNHKVDFGISAGLGGEFFASPRHSMYLEARFYYGLGNVLKSGRTDPFSASNSMTLSATLGYWFRIK